ncbi:hypothetical protein V6N13_084471 [Hibiscus sabdariffa]
MIGWGRGPGQLGRRSEGGRRALLQTPEDEQSPAQIYTVAFKSFRPSSCPRGLDALFFLWRRCLLPEVERGTASIVSAYLGSGLEKASRLVNGDGDEGESEGYGSLREEATVAGEFIGDW